MDSPIDKEMLREEEAINEQLEELKSRVTQLHKGIPCLKQCAHFEQSFYRRCMKYGRVSTY